MAKKADKLVEFVEQLNELGVFDDEIDTSDDEETLEANYIAAIKMLYDEAPGQMDNLSEEALAFWEQTKAEYFPEEFGEGSDDEGDEEGEDSDDEGDEEGGEEPVEKPKKKEKSKEKAKKEKKAAPKKEKKKKAPPKKDEPRSCYGHLKSALSGQLDEAFQQGGTVEELCNAAGVSPSRIKSHMAALKKKGLTILEKDAKDSRGRPTIFYKVKESNISEVNK